MATNNFYYENRCVVLDNDDMEDIIDNIGINKYFEHSYNRLRNFPTFLLSIQPDDVNMFVVVMTYGYYAGACLDFIMDKDIDYVLEDIENDSQYTKGGYKRTQKQIENIITKEEKRQRKICNKFLDKLKSEYGLIEVVKISQLSNGEALYSKI